MSKREFQRLCYVHGPDVSMIAMLSIGVLVEVVATVFVWGSGLHFVFGAAAVAFSVAIVGYVLGIVRFEQRANQYR